MTYARATFIARLLRRRYGTLAVALTLVVWASVALAMRPVRGRDGRYDTYPYGLTTAPENHALDLLFQLRDALRPESRARGLNEPITIVAVDDAAIAASGVRLQKWPRDWYARLVDRAREGGARVVGLDVYLSEEGGTTGADREADRLLAEAIYNTENIVIPTKLEAGGTRALVPLPAFAEGATAVGFVDFPHDSDNTVRASQLVAPGQAAQFSFGAALAQLYSGLELRDEPNLVLRFGERVLPLRNDTTLQLDFRGRTPAFRHVSARDILSPGGAGVPDELFRDRIVLIGATNNDAPDLFQTPFYEPAALARLFDPGLPLTPARVPGVEIHATAAATLLSGGALARPSYAGRTASLLLPLGLVALAVFTLRALWGVAAVLLTAGALLAVSVWAFDSFGLILPLATAWLGVAALAPAGFVLRYARERVAREEQEAERAQIMDIFSRCVSPEVAEELWHKRGQVALGGESRVLTVIFTDIRNFTTLSESAASGEVVEWLNDYFGRMHEIVCRHGGHINKFTGDGLLIVFGAPVDRGVEPEARAAVACGLGMLEEVARMAEEWRAAGRPRVRIGVGVHTGEATCGVVGAPGRLEYTVIGDTVNLAARLESATKELGADMLVSAATAAHLGGDYEARPLGDVLVKGKTESTAVFAVAKKEAAPARPTPAAV